MGQNIFRAKMKARILKMRERQNKQTPAGKVEATQIAATVAVITVVFFILKYVFVSQVINFDGSPLMIFDEEYQSPERNIYALIIFMYTVGITFFVYMLTRNISNLYQKCVDKNTTENKINKKFNSSNVVINDSFNIKDFLIWVTKFIIILFIIAILCGFFYFVFPLLLKKLPKILSTLLIVFIFLVIFYFMLRYQNQMTNLTLFNLSLITSTFIMIFLMAITLKNEEPKQNQYIMHYYDEKDIRRNMIISKDNYFQTADKVIIFDKNNDNKTIYIPKGRVLMYEKNKIKND